MTNPEHKVSMGCPERVEGRVLTIFVVGEAEDDAGGEFWVGVLDRKIRFTDRVDCKPRSDSAGG